MARVVLRAFLMTHALCVHPTLYITHTQAYSMWSHMRGRLWYLSRLNEKNMQLFLIFCVEVDVEKQIKIRCDETECYLILR